MGLLMGASVVTELDLNRSRILTLIIKGNDQDRFDLTGTSDRESTAGLVVDILGEAARTAIQIAFYSRFQPDAIQL